MFGGIPIGPTHRYATRLQDHHCRMRLATLHGQPSPQWNRGPHRCYVEGDAFVLWQAEPPGYGLRGPSVLAIEGRWTELPLGTMFEIRHVLRVWAACVISATLIAIALLLAIRAGLVSEFVASDQRFDGFSLGVVALGLTVLPLGVALEIFK
jgi:hypothetical protein